MTFLAVTAVVSTGFAYGYVCNNSQYNCNTNTQYNSTYFYQEFILLKYSMAFGENSTNVFP